MKKTEDKRERIFQIEGCEHKGNNRYKMVVSAGFNADGKRNRRSKTVTALTKKELENLYAQFKTEVRKGLFLNNSNLTLREFVELHWLLDPEIKALAPKTLFRYKELLMLRILPELGHIKLSDIKRNHIVKFYESMTQEGARLDKKEGRLSDRTILHHHRLLSKIFTTAVYWEFVPDSPMKMVRAPKVSRSEMPYYNDEQVLTLIERLCMLDESQYRYKVVTMLALFTGMRCGELMGLEWTDIDFDNRTVSISRSSQYLPGQGTFTKEAKTDLSHRCISIPATIVKLLKDYQQHQENEKLQISDLWKHSDRLFTTWNGEPMSPNTITGWFRKFIKANNLPHITFHGLRHTNASLLIADGVDVKTIASRLGHTTPTTTLNVYSHMLKKSDQNAADTLEKRLAGAKKEQSASETA